MKPVWIENPESVGLRLVGLAHEVSPAGYAYSRNAIEHTGWYIDHHFEETCCGVVYQTSGKDGHARYIAGVADPHNDGPAYLCLEPIDGERRDSDWESDNGLRDAARAADSIAEQWAETERDYQTAWQAGSQWRELRDEEQETRRDTLALLKENRESVGPAIRSAIHDTVCRAWRHICYNRSNRSNLAGGQCRDLYWYNGDERLRDAFCEGADIKRFPV